MEVIFFGAPSGKKLYIQLFLKIKDMAGEMCSALVVTPLRSIIDDQIKEADGLGITAISLVDAKLENVSIVFVSVEDTLDLAFLKLLKGHFNNFHKRLSAIIVNKLRTVETWTEKR